MPLRYNVGTNNYGKAIANLFEIFGAKKVTVQRLGELVQNRGSKPEKINEWRIIPTLKDMSVGDIGGGMPYRLMKDLLWGLKKLDVEGLIKGIYSYDTLLYGPELKTHGLELNQNEYLGAKCMQNIIFIGDGSGLSRGIGGAMASGILAAEGILKNI